MNYLISFLLAAILCAIASAQTIKTLGYNTTNGQVVANTGASPLAFTSKVTFLGGISGSEEEGLEVRSAYELKNENGSVLSYVFDDPDENKWKVVNPAEFRSALGMNGRLLLVDFEAEITNTILQYTTNWSVYNNTNFRLAIGLSTNLNTLWTATNASNARTAVGLGATNSVAFAEISANFIDVDYLNASSTTNVSQIKELLITGTNGVQFNEAQAISATRANLGLPLAALTNTSNVTAMRALAGSTNTNEPYSGTISLTNTNTLTFSNGVLLKIQ